LRQRGVPLSPEGGTEEQVIIPEPGLLLSEQMLSRRGALPLKPAQVTLTGRYVQLAPLQERHIEPLFAVSNGSPATVGDRGIDPFDAERLIWRYMTAGPFTVLDDFRSYCRQCKDVPNGMSFCVIDLPSQHPVGMTNLMNNSPDDLKIELGGIWYSPLVQRSAANTEATYLMLKHVFDLGYRRAEWKSDALNERSRRAARRMGFTFEGIQQQHMIVKDRNRDTVWYRILNDEWPSVEARLRKFLYRN